MTQRSPEPTAPNLVFPRKEVEEKIKAQLEKARELQAIKIVSEDDFDQATAEKSKWEKYTAELLTRSFDTSKIADEFTYVSSISAIPFGATGKWFANDFRVSISNAITRLEAIHERLDLIPELAGSVKATQEKINNAASRIFIAHGRSNAWKDLKDLIEDRLNLPSDEFNREPTAGLGTKERIEEMLNNAVFAFIVLTAEDEHSDGTFHPRENVIHEAGLFQGRLGFKKAIILREDGCVEFSNIHGLTQIQFPKGNIMAKSEDIRRVLEREGILKKDKES